MQMELLNLKASKDGHRLVLSLRGRRCVSRNQLMKETGMSARQLRLERVASNGRVISGSFGYCLFVEADAWMREEFVARSAHQGEEMIRQARRVQFLIDNPSLCRA